MDKPKLTKQMIEGSRVIARGTRIHDVNRLLRVYGGRRAGWVKKSSPTVWRMGIGVEYDWYEHHGIGRVEVKRVERRGRFQ